jgi:DNA-directed RNA polymerase specialized sigma24 family protein
MDETSYRALLDAQDWADAHARLLDFALSRCGKKATAQAKDLAQTAIARVFAHDSTWDPQKEPDLVRYLMSVVNSLLANERRSHAAQKNVSMEKNVKTRRAAERVTDAQAWSEDAAVEHDLFARRLTLLKERVADDPNVLELLACMARRLDSAEDIRHATGWTSIKLRAVQRRMQRAAALVARDLGGSIAEPGENEDEDDDEEEEVA